MATHTERPPCNARGATGNEGPVENPLDFMTDNHMREREVCAFIDRLVAALPVSPEEHNMMVTFVNVQLPQHLADEEIDLLVAGKKRLLRPSPARHPFAIEDCSRH